MDVNDIVEKFELRIQDGRLEAMGVDFTPWRRRKGHEVTVDKVDNLLIECTITRSGGRQVEHWTEYYKVQGVKKLRRRWDDSPKVRHFKRPTLTPKERRAIRRKFGHHQSCRCYHCEIKNLRIKWSIDAFSQSSSDEEMLRPTVPPVELPAVASGDSRPPEVASEAATARDP